MLVTLPNEEWRTALASTESALTLLNPTSLEIQFHKCLVTDDPLLPKLRLIGHLPSVTMNLTDVRLLQALAIAQSIPVPEEEKPAETQRVSLSKSVSQLSLKELGTTISSIADKKKQQETDAAPMKQTIDLEMKFEMKEFTLSVSRQQSGHDAASEFVRSVRWMRFPFDLLFIILLQSHLCFFLSGCKCCSWRRTCCNVRTIKK